MSIVSSPEAPFGSSTSRFVTTCGVIRKSPRLTTDLRKIWRRVSARQITQRRRVRSSNRCLLLRWTAGGHNQQAPRAAVIVLLRLACKGRGSDGELVRQLARRTILLDV